ncbi:PLC-like phosphodiesterase, partial [Elsinoe ampelina]
ACNNFAALCDRSYSNITQLGAHNSPFLRDGANGLVQSGNHYYNSTVQLDAGVRLLTAQVHRQNTTLQLCHSSCALLDAGPLTTWLTSIVTWLTSNPNEVVTLILVNADSASASDIATSYATADAVSLSYAPPSTSSPPNPWPSLRDLIANQTRLITFVSSIDPSPSAPYLLDEFTYLFETPFRSTSPADLLRCGVDRPTSFGGNTATALQNRLLPLVNHFLYDNGTSVFGSSVNQPDEARVNVTNAPGGPGEGNLGVKSDRCAAEYGRAPWGVLVDFFNVGPAVQTVDRLNGVSVPVGR